MTKSRMEKNGKKTMDIKEILQKAVEIKEDDNRESLADRIHRVEHKLYPQALNILFSRNWKVVKKRRFILS